MSTDDRFVIICSSVCDVRYSLAYSLRSSRRVRFHCFLTFILIAVLVIFTGCGGAVPATSDIAAGPTVTTNPPTASAVPATPTSSATSIPATPTSAATTTSTRVARQATPAADNKLIGSLKKDHYTLTMDCYGEGSPTVVLDASLDGGWGLWDRRQVHREVAKFTRVCRYNRIGRPPTPLTSQQIAQDLHELLNATSVDAPYISVGMSFAGFTARIFTTQFRDEVAGLVLIDASHPEDHARFSALIPPEHPNDSFALKQLRKQVAMNNEQLLREHGVDFDASATQARDTGPFGELPLVVVTAGRPVLGQTFPQDFQEQWERVRLEMQTELTHLSTNSRQIIAEQSGHCVQCDQPEVVISAIHQVFEVARSGN